jgi:hypothetical protein
MKQIITLTLTLFLLVGIYPVTEASAQAGQTPPTIISFSSELEAITVDEAEAGDTETTLSWVVVGMNETQQIRLEQYVLNQWVSLSAEDDDPLADSGSLTLPVEHPLTFAPPTYRLSIVDASGVFFDQRVITIPYTTDEELSPEILSFTAEMNADDLGLSSSVANVAWEVSNRTPTSNLVFEQLLADGTFVSIEQPRNFLWIASQGSGQVVPVAEDNTSSVQLRLSVVDLIENEILAEELIQVDLNGSTTSVLTATPEETTPAVVGNMQLVEFSATPNPAERSATVTVSWEVSGADSITVSRLDPGGQFADFRDEQPASGSWTLTLPAYHVDSAMFQLAATNDNGNILQESLTVDVICPYDYFFDEVEPGVCPESEPQDVYTAYQAFDGGMMLWRSDDQAIYVLYPNGTWEQYEDTWEEGDPINPTSTEPPEDLFQPIRGFGKVWAENSQVRNQLGWALFPERDYTATIQETGGLRNQRIYMTLADQRVVELMPSAGQWEYLPS